MNRLLTLLLALLCYAPVTWADETDEYDAFPTVDVGEMVLDQRYYTEMFSNFAGTFCATETGLYRVLSTTSDYPMPYYDAAHGEIINDIIVSFYEGKQGYVIHLDAGERIYLFRSFCMNPSSSVWIERCAAVLDYTATPVAGDRLLPTGAGQLILNFSQPAACDGGWIACGGEREELAPSGGGLAILYDVKEIVMGWVRKGIAAGTDITLHLDNVRAIADPNIKAGNGGTLDIHYVMPEAPGEYVSDNFYNRLFRSYWLDDDEGAVFRMTFTRPVNVKDPGYLNLIYGSASDANIGVMTLRGQADGYDIVFDLRGKHFRPSDLIAPGNMSRYDSIRVCPGSIRDDNGDYMFSPGAGSLGSWDYLLPYIWYDRQVTLPWELTDQYENPLDYIEPGTPMLAYFYMWDYYRFDGFRFDYDDGESVVVPLDEAEIEVLGSDAEVTFRAPYVYTYAPNVRVSLENFALYNGQAVPDWSETVAWEVGNLTDLTAAPASPLLPPASPLLPPASPPALSDWRGSLLPPNSYLLSGRRATSHAPGIVIRPGRKEIVK